MSLLKQDILRKKQVNKKFLKLDFNTGNSKEYKGKIIQDYAIYSS